MNIPEIEKASRRAIEDYQSVELIKLLQYVNQHSTFYKSHFSNHNIDIKDIKSLSDLNHIPPIEKKDIQKSTSDFYCVDNGQIIDYCNTSGTEGSPVTVPLTEKDLNRLAYNEALSLACTGGTNDEIYQLTTTINRRFMAGLAYALGARKLGAGMIRIGPGVREQQWQTIHELKPTALIVVPSFLLKLIEYAENNDIDYKICSIKKAVCIGESIRENSFELNALGKRISEKWDIALYSTYASTEMATAFTECEEGKGGHAHPELIITEILDENNNPVPEGESGELTITTLGVEGMPLIRFKTGDICIRYSETCKCGRNTYRLGPVIGRKNQMIKYKGTTMFPAAIFELLDNVPEISSYAVEVGSDEFQNDLVTVRYTTKKPINLPKLAERFQSQLKVTPAFEEMTPNELHAIIFLESSRKPIKFIDKRIKFDI